MMLFFTIVLLWWGAGLVGHLIGFLVQYFDERLVELDVEDVISCLFTALLAGPIVLVASICYFFYYLFSWTKLTNWINNFKFKTVIHLQRKK